MFGKTMRSIVIAATVCLLIQPSIAQNYPSRVIRVVVPYAPGGLGDVLARVIGQKLSQSLGQNVIIENKPGAAGMVGAAAVAQATPDGYTVLLGYTSEMTVAPSLVGNPMYDTERDFEPVALGGTSPLLLVAHPSVQANSVKGFIGLAKANPGRYAYASAGAGSPAQFAGELLKHTAGIDLLHVPYKGGAQAITDLIGGSVQIYFSGFPPALPQVKAGKLKAFGVTGAKRSPALPEAPTLIEEGLKNFDLSGWFGFFVPRSTPDAISKLLNDQIAVILRQPDVRATLIAQGVEVNPMTQTQFKTFVSQEMRKYQGLIKTLDIKGE